MHQNARLQQSIQVNLKRNVTINVEITEKFKNDLIKELNANADLAEQKLKELQQKIILVDPKDQANLQSELSKLSQLLSQVPAQKETIQKMTIGSIFQQGIVESTVAVKVGDHLYEKLHGLEILVKDGVIIDIKYGSKRA